MANIVILGMQWGDEGKGKIVDLVCPAFDAVVRYQGGHNAGHTVKFADRHFALHFLPSGILHEGIAGVLGNGMVIAPEAFFEELAKVESGGIDTRGRLFISDRAQVILPLHVELDRGREQARGDGKIGTTVRGIGPAYETKIGRTGLRTCDLLARDLEERLTLQLEHLGPQLRALDLTPAMDVAALADACRGWGERLAPSLRDVTQLLARWIAEGKSLLFEGAQGALLDVDHGTYPYVTSSNTIAGGVCTGAGVAPTRIDGALGVLKAYTTRVGAGPFPTEHLGELGEHLRRRGNEFGTTTGRPRRCGWFDAVAARYARLLSGIDVIALTKLDVLDQLEELRICTGYRYRGEVRRDFPAELEVLHEAEPVYRTVKGWQTKTEGILAFDDLPAAARDYIALLEDEVGAPVGIVSTGPRREETLLVDGSATRRVLGDAWDAVLAGRGA